MAKKVQLSKSFPTFAPGSFKRAWESFRRDDLLDLPESNVNPYPIYFTVDGKVVEDPKE